MLFVIKSVIAHCNESIFRHKGAPKRDYFSFEVRFSVADVADVANVAPFQPLTRWHLFSSL